jgi:hypothetical protein
MLRGFILGAVCAVVVLALAVYAAIATGAMPANADSRPPSLERWAARRSLHASLSRAPKVTNPLPDTSAAHDVLKGHGSAHARGGSSVEAR